MSKARQLADLGNVYDDGALSNRNLIINGAMNVAQRGTSKTGLVGQEYATVDRFKTAISSLGTWTASQSTDAPDGFSNSLKYECTTADASPASSDFMRVETRLEAQDLQHLAFGTSNAKELTLSFWVKSNKTGDYVSWIYQTDDTRSFSTTYTINTSATWEYKVITIPADTVGVIDNNNDIGLMLFWCLGAGADYTGGSSSSSWGADVAANRYVGQTVNLADTTGNYWQITGVQLEVGDTATPFEHRSISDELARCQRYYQEILKGSKSFGIGVNYKSTQVHFIIDLPVVMRAQPSATITSGSNYYVYYVTNVARYFDNFTYETNASSDRRVEFYDSTNPSGTIGQSGMVRGSNPDARVVLDAEL